MLERFLNHLGIQVSNTTSSNLLCMCPFHGDLNTPSLSIREDGAYYCFLFSCDVHGWSFVKLAMEAGYQYKEAQGLVESFELPLKANVDRSHTKKLQRPEQILVGKYSTDWHQAYHCYTKGIPHEEELVANAAGYLFGIRNLHPETLASAGVGLDRKNKAIVFPQFKGSTCVGLSFRKINDKQYYFQQPFSKSEYLYLDPDPNADEVILVEGQMDALAVSAVVNTDDIKAVGAIYGSQLSLTQAEHLDGVPEVILFFDNDTAGVVATSKALSILGPHRCSVVVNYDNCKDAGEMTSSQIYCAIRTAVSGKEYSGAEARYRLSLVKNNR